MEQYLGEIQTYITSAGIWAPVIYVFAMALAVVFSPIPSSPLAIFAGVAFGWFKGMALTLLGATLGAAIAFLIAKKFGRLIVLKILGAEKLEKIDKLLPENRLTLAVFLLRLPPLPVFDAVSYAAGLTKIHFKNFSIATFFGLIPITFALSYYGESIKSIASLLTGIAFISVAFAVVIWLYNSKA